VNALYMICDCNLRSNLLVLLGSFTSAFPAISVIHMQEKAVDLVGCSSISASDMSLTHGQKFTSAL
jgi:hypothetical protein